MVFVQAWGTTTRPTRCGGGFGCQTRVSSQAAAAAWDLYCAATEELAMMNINGYHSGRGLLDHPRKHPLAAAKISNDGSGFYSRQSLQYQKLQAIQVIDHFSLSVSLLDICFFLMFVLIFSCLLGSVSAA